MNDTESIKAGIRIAASPAEVFPYLVDPALIVQWIGISADVNPEAGGVFAIDFRTTSTRGTYVCVEPPHRVVFTWGIPETKRFRPALQRSRFCSPPTATKRSSS